MTSARQELNFLQKKPLQGFSWAKSDEYSRYVSTLVFNNPESVRAKRFQDRNSMLILIISSIWTLAYKNCLFLVLFDGFILSCLIERPEKLPLFFNADIHSYSFILRKRFHSTSAFSVVLYLSNLVTLKSSKGLIGGIIAAVIIYGTVPEDMCEGINCGIGGNCTGGNCTCGTGYANVENFCQDMCEGVDCGRGGDCLNGICSCQTGYANVENYCEESCALNPCKELITRVIYFIFV